MYLSVALFTTPERLDKACAGQGGRSRNNADITADQLQRSEERIKKH